MDCGAAGAPNPPVAGVVDCAPKAKGLEVGAAVGVDGVDVAPKEKLGAVPAAGWVVPLAWPNPPVLVPNPLDAPAAGAEPNALVVGVVAEGAPNVEGFEANGLFPVEPAVPLAGAPKLKPVDVGVVAAEAGVAGLVAAAGAPNVKAGVDAAGAAGAGAVDAEGAALKPKPGDGAEAAAAGAAVLAPNWNGDGAALSLIAGAVDDDEVDVPKLNDGAGAALSVAGLAAGVEDEPKVKLVLGASVAALGASDAGAPKTEAGFAAAGSVVAAVEGAPKLNAGVDDAGLPAGAADEVAPKVNEVFAASAGLSVLGVEPNEKPDVLGAGADGVSLALGAPNWKVEGAPGAAAGAAGVGAGASDLGAPNENPPVEAAAGASSFFFSTPNVNVDAPVTG